ncbi:hypothetical protein FB567DRAFT_258385 [Paraphoma chrysanthemicola]|uniref:Uncharacterized protein n=1 Tax=Paraphoma chrysanthemicola TaxID=798071 RepID=A0A8K0QR38_9PLEO|nr:hypothetical protein FB567DRAFT_258385 [Paraphoma chrysanthemicola]
MMANEKFLKWADEELVPLLKYAYGKSLHKSWEWRIVDASRSIANLVVKEDFPSTVERVRLLLVNPEIMTPADVRNFGWVRREIDVCIGVFVRHALKHGTYMLASLGTEPDPDHPRRKLSDGEMETYIWGGKFAAK